MCIHEQWWLHCTSQWGWQTPLSEHVYGAAGTFKMTEQVEQWICIKFCVKLEHSSMDTIQMIQKAAAVGPGDSPHDNVPTHASCIVQSFFAKHQSTQVTQPSYNPDLVPCDFWLFQKLTSPLKGKRFQTIDEIQECTTCLLYTSDAADDIGQV